MNKVIIVDDDHLVRMSLKMMIDWQAYGFEIVGEASNGKAGLEMVKDLKPDMAIVDVKMPIMDGLQLSQEIMRLDQELYYIMLSNYDEYEYVRGAMKNGASDFLLKHMLNEELLIEQLTNASKALSQRDKKSKGVHGTNQDSKDHFILSLLVGDLVGEKAIADYVKEHELPIGLRKVIPIIMVIDGYHNSIVEKGMDYLFKLRKNISVTLKEILDKEEHVIFTRVEDNKYLLLVSYEDLSSEKQIYEARHGLLRHIQEQIQRYYNESVSFSVGSIRPLYKIKGSYTKAYQLLKQKFYQGAGVILDQSNSYPLISIDPKEFLKDLHMKSFGEVINNRNVDKAQGEMKKILSALEYKKINQKSVMDIMDIITTDIVQYLNNIGVPKEEVFGKQSYKEQLKSMETIDELQTWLDSCIKKVFQLSEQEEKSLSTVVSQAKMYVLKNYGEFINLASTAEEIGVNSSYLSKVFKEEMGVGFNQYLCQVRIIKAKALMDKGEELKSIPLQCGFQDYPYFSKVFKRQEGYPPSQYNHLKKEQ